VQAMPFPEIEMQVAIIVTARDVASRTRQECLWAIFTSPAALQNARSRGVRFEVK
jgi:hypothetical protein